MVDPNKFVSKTLWWVLTGLSLLLTSACSNDSVEVTAHFDNTRDIESGTKVYWQDASVGVVKSVALIDNGSQVVIGFEPAQASKISQDAAVVVNRIKPGKPLEIHNPAGPVTETLQAGQAIQAVDSMLELMAWSLGDALNSGGKQLSSMVTGFQDYVQGEEFQRNKQQFQQQVTDAIESTASALKTLEQDLTDSMQNMVATEEQMAGAIEDLGDELAPMVEEMSRSSAELSVQIDQFLQRMENATPEQRASGERLMQSLAAMLEKLNTSMQSNAPSQQDDKSAN